MDRCLATVVNQKQQRLKGARFVRQDLAATLEQPLKVFLWTRAGKNLDARRGPSGLQGILEGLLSFVQDEDRRSHRRRSNRRGQASVHPPRRREYQPFIRRLESGGRTEAHTAEL